MSHLRSKKPDLPLCGSPTFSLARCCQYQSPGLHWLSSTCNCLVMKLYAHIQGQIVSTPCVFLSFLFSCCLTLIILFVMFLVVLLCTFPFFVRFCLPHFLLFLCVSIFLCPLLVSFYASSILFTVSCFFLSSIFLIVPWS